MLIPSIDLMGGKIVQLVQGRQKALEFDNFQEWVDRFSKYPLIQLIDLDAAMGNGHNADLVREFARQLPCQVGGGIRSLEAAQATLGLGARRVILGSSLISKGAINSGFAQQMADEFGPGKLVFAVDSRGGRVAIKGWQETTDISPLEMMRALEPFCSAFLYTHIDTEGLLQGIPFDTVRELRNATSRELIAAGGIRTQEEIDTLHAIGVDAVVGMAIYQGLLPV
ncbi:MAG: 1-(5-phosphoribosyl)-5-[(5-phosphoribosylamino)methylideneamino] imidazole-4-carboxamide isomerase [Acidobacteriales bacterium]|nr:1-(5-phosphoribosyl)-5-[(5-phosphoribosylamino)methylideneamino] imidazole-4-carboxamide isomerase [Candidatus Koribacter versatilis]MBI3646708.1 1-(5-phosphoribosyl)-5-[(5-phosphoribosylamino)methylideneamino] imidazole-4-carboxamide isomerase [Terriglobales bacterium]